MEEILEKFRFYHKKYEIIKRAHHLAAEAYSSYNNFLGVPVVILTTFISTAIFASLKEKQDESLIIITGLIAVLATVLSALQTFLGYSEKAASHKMAGIKYAAIRRQFDTLHLKYSTIDNPDKKQALIDLEDLLKIIDELAERMPAIPDKFSFQAKRERDNETG